MATILAQAINAAQTTFIVNGSDIFDTSALPNRVTLGSEVLYVHAVEPLSGGLNRLSVSRGVDRTTPATHALATALTSTPLGSGGGGGVSVTDGTLTVATTKIQVPPGMVVDAGGGTAILIVLRLLQSAAITPAVPNLVTPGLTLWSVAGGDFAVGDVILDMWADVTQDWDGTTALLTVSANSDGQSNALYYTQPDLQDTKSVSNNLGSTPGLSSTDRGGPGGSAVPLSVLANQNKVAALWRVLPASVLRTDLEIGLTITSGDWTQGSLKMLAIIATPAS